jgi:hypothetical protein
MINPRVVGGGPCGRPLVLRYANAFTVALTFRSALADLKVGATKD